MPDSSSGPRFEIEVEAFGSTSVVTVIGDIDMTTTESFRSAIESALTASPTALVVDFTEVGFLGTSAMTVLVSAHDRVGEETSILVVADKPATRRPFELAGLTDVLSVHSTRTSAIESAQRSGPGTD